MSYELDAGSMSDLVTTSAEMTVLVGLWDRAGRVGSEIARFDGGHCIDAPELLPAGGCRSFRAEEFDIPEQITYWRPGCKPLAGNSSRP